MTTARASSGDAWAELRSVSKTYQSRNQPVTAVHDVSLSIARGEFISIVGPSGCGKSTLLSMLAGLSQPTTGEVRIHGQAITKPYPGVGIVFQRDLLLEWLTVKQNVLFQIDMRRGRVKDYEGRARELLAQVGLQGFENRYPSELSGGMRQRVAICRALIHSPEVLLLDEPFGALDSLTREQMNLDLQDLWLDGKPTVVLITHDINEALFLSDRVLVMSSRPGTFVDDIRIDVPRPRDVSSVVSEEMRVHAATIRTHFENLGVLGHRTGRAAPPTETKEG
ncbi:ABC transporter ATP-binding protein [Compostimonas suwonensis]|uniref:NitT/TauT family transport system ATP-binding protein n=1 Tax=Compostimonas suwonensis TaxID=1048394 RepID=A0A2M9C499_9MICO|nr:ABC transporter ATP-binding protein [Compostimonas suwonensis]PJJ65354.1 NitT/TauT family transport system ATP-binding protein [Compostimonas suwonensis]